MRKLPALITALTALIFLCLCSSFLFAQGGSVYRQVISPPPPTGTGQPAFNATVRVCTGVATGTPCSPLVANIYSDEALTTPISNPLSTDANGNYYFFIGTGTYLVQETPVAGTTYSFLVFVNGTGTVSSVALSMPGSVFSVTGNPITTSGTFNVALLTQSANEVFANCTGSTATPSFCSLTADMIPSTLNATTVNGTLNIGGTTTITTGNLAVSSGNASISGTLGAGDTTISGTLDANNTTVGTLSASGAAVLATTLSVGTNETVGGTLGVTGATSLSSLTLNSSQSLTGTQGTAGTKIVTGSGTWTDGHHLCANATSDAVDCGATYSNTVATINAGGGAGTGPTITCINDASNQCYNGFGVVQVATGSGPATLATVFSIVFGGSGWTDAFCTFAPADANASNLPGTTAYIHGVLASSPPISYSLVVSPAVTGHLVGSTTYTWSYQCSFL